MPEFDAHGLFEVFGSTRRYSIGGEIAVIERVQKSIYPSIVLLSMLTLWLAGCAAPVDPPRISAPPTVPPPSTLQNAATLQRTIVVVGNGNVRVQANMARLDLGVEVVDETLSVANQQASELMQRILDTLASQRIAEDDIKPYAYNISAERYYPDYDRDDPGTVPLFPDANEAIRYRVIHQIHVNVRAMDRVPDVVAAVIEAGGSHFYLYAIDFLYDDPSRLEADSRAKAIADAQRKAEAIAVEIDVQLGPVIAISELIEAGGARWDSYIPPIWPGQLQFYKQLQLTYALVENSPITVTSPITK